MESSVSREFGTFSTQLELVTTKISALETDTTEKFKNLNDKFASEFSDLEAATKDNSFTLRPK